MDMGRDDGLESGLTCELGLGDECSKSRAVEEVEGFAFVVAFICLDNGDGGAGDGDDAEGLDRLCELPPHSDMKERTVKERTERNISECSRN